MSNAELINSDFPALHLVRTGRFVRFVGRLTLYCLIATIIIMIFVPWQQTARGTGTVIAVDPQERPQPVLCPVKGGGVISYVKPGLREGTYVEEGDLLLKISPFANEEEQQLKQQITELRAAKASVDVILAEAIEIEKETVVSGTEMLSSLGSKLESFKAKLEQKKNELEVEKNIYNDKKNKYEVALRTLPAGLVPQQEVFSYLQEFRAAVNKVDKAENAREEAAQDVEAVIADIESKRNGILVKNREATQKVAEKRKELSKLNKDILDLQNKLNLLDRNKVYAPRSGLIQQWNGLSDSFTVKETDQLFVIVPAATDMAIEMQVSGNDIPLIHEDDHVRLQFEGWPAVQFVGWPSVAVGTFGGKVDRVFPTDDGKGNFRIIVTPDKQFAGETDWPDNRYLRQGVRANGWVLLRTVPLGYEIWRQLNGFPPVVSDSEPGKKDDKGSKVKLPKP
ncbi:MAG TPA: hemolysin D [Planctomycetaceae bacterium]|nr:hemolysin D [Planctomycetaceae bacterium]